MGMNKIISFHSERDISAPAAAFQAAAVIGCAAASDTYSEPGSLMLD
jgi:hypothetical protein